MNTKFSFLKSPLLSFWHKPSLNKSLLKYSTKKLPQEPFLNGSSSQYIEDMYNAWLKDSSSVHVSWNSYFTNAQYQSPQNLSEPGRNEVLLNTLTVQRQATQIANTSIEYLPEKNVKNHLAVQALIRRYQTRGHLIAKLDPLEIMDKERRWSDNGKVDLSHKEIISEYQLTENDLNRKFTLPQATFIGGKEQELTLQEIINRLEQTYCGHIGAEYMYINNVDQIDWIREKLETPDIMKLTKAEKKVTLERLMRTTNFEGFLAKKWSSEKRFGIEGCEMFIPAMKSVIDTSTVHGVKTIVMGMAHRGRLNVLANVLRKPLYQLFVQFSAVEPADFGSGDVKYHLGTQIERLNRVTNKNVKLILVANPSHLESTSPVVEGRARAEQFFAGDHEGKTVMPVLIHGDAAFSGQGVVYETLHLSDLPSYTAHGTVHFVINNQIGFTTDPRFSRSSPYCTDVARVVNAPIFHVNVQDPDKVIHVAKIAAEWRAKFHKDVVIDLVCYRRSGHQEVDEPMFTQPLMYKKIKTMKPILFTYLEQVLKEGAITNEEYSKAQMEYNEVLEQGFLKASKETHMLFKDWIDSPWNGFFQGKDELIMKPTGVKEETLKHIGVKCSSPPSSSLDFQLFKGLEKILQGRMKMIENKTVDFALAEAMAFGSLLKEGISVRLSGEDVERGTFSHRHHVYHHQSLDKVTYKPLDSLYPDQASYTVCNSSLSEYGVLGFELGYSVTNPNSLTIWEAQFGDFVNTAQCVIDTFIASGETKWVRQSGLVMYLPHGSEGMGPEHTSARMERFLQMSSDDPEEMPNYSDNYVVQQLRDINWICTNVSTAANLFHLLRRQIYLPFRKPLMIFTPKFLLRFSDARSRFDEMIENTEFQRIYRDDLVKDYKDVKKIIFCSGKVYYDVKQQRKKKQLDKDIMIVRIEQICPFPYDLLKIEIDKCPIEVKLCWVQEEHKNAGAWSYVEPRFRTLLAGKRNISYVGRPSSASPATGVKSIYVKELADFLEASMLI